MSRKTILCVEDDKTLSIMYGWAFKPLDCDLKQCSNGVEALEWLEANTPVAIFTDVMMPRMGGVKMAKQIRSKHPRLKDVPIIFISAFDNPEGRHEAMEAGGTTTRYKVKPILIGEIRDLARELLR